MPIAALQPFQHSETSDLYIDLQLVMSATHCCIPSCTWSRRRSKERRSLFTILRPDLARSEDEKRHREKLTDFVLSLRDYTRGDMIKSMLHKQSAAICDVHFKKEDIILKGKKTTLRVGALPALYLPPKELNRQHERKPAVLRKLLPMKKKHPSVSILKSAIATSNPALIVTEEHRQSGYRTRARLKPDAMPTTFLAGGKKGVKTKCKRNAAVKLKKARICQVKEALNSTDSAKRAPYILQCLALLHHDYILTMTTTLKDDILWAARSSKSGNNGKSHKKYSKKICNDWDKPKKGKRRKKRRLIPVHGRTEGGKKIVMKSNERNNHSKAQPREERCGQISKRTNKRGRKVLHVAGYSDQSCESSKKRRRKVSIESSSPVSQNNDKSPLIVKEEPLWDEDGQDVGNTDQKESLLTVSHIGNDRTLVIKKEPSCNEEESKDTFNEDAYSKRMTQSMYSMQKNEALCDFTILVESEDTERHVPVLVHRLAFSFASNSIVFREGLMLDASRHMNRCVASNIIEFVYTGKISELSSFSCEKIEKLKSAARFLQIPDCLSYLERHNSLERSTMSSSHSHDDGLEWLRTTPDLMPPIFMTGQS